MPRTDPGVQRAARFVRLAAPTLNRTYEISLAILFLDRLGDTEDHKLLRSLALRLAAGQDVTGGWGYTCPVLKPDQEQKLLEQMRQRRDATRSRPAAAPKPPGEEPNEKVEPPKVAQRSGGKKSAGAPASGKARTPKIQVQGDNSNTQFAVLALWAARRYDLPLEPTVARIAQRFRYSQLRDGGWFYRLNNPQTRGSMTCVGLLGLSLGRAWEVQTEKSSGKPMQARAEDPGILRGLGALAGRIADPNDGYAGAKLSLYFMWSVERVGVLCGLRTIGRIDWYRWGAWRLVLAQRPDGSWFEQRHFSAPTTDTCMALLFLKRADLMPGLGEELRKRVEITDPWLSRKGGDPKKGAKTPGGTATAKPAPAPKPLSADLGEVKVGTPTERRIVLRCATPFKVSGVGGTDRYLRAKVERRSQGEQVLTVTIQPSEPGALTRTLRLATDLPGRPEVEVTIKAHAVP